ncbi:MAG TPA: murein transglycosylase A [Alphaproteobacteria bacterium]|nr:murein transglycosylase A [Alphaproteobacteria bacterium]
MGRMMLIRFFAILIILAGSVSCSLEREVGMGKEQTLNLMPVSFSELAGWHEDNQDAALLAFSRSCEKILKRNPEDQFGPSPDMGMVKDWQAACAHLPDWELSTPEQARSYFEEWFIPYVMSNNGNEEGLFTGYYEPGLRGSLSKGGQYTIPLRTRPGDLVMVNLGEFRDELKGQRIAGRVVGGNLKPYEDRGAIEDGKLPHQVDVPLVWVDSAVDAFFLQVQGSGLIELDIGEVMRVGYDGQNGHIYTAIGKELVTRGELTKDNVSMQTIRAWLAEHPEEGREVMRLNKSYVFFRKLETDGPVGAEGVVLVPERSLAVDPVFVPYGAPIFLDAENPEGGAPNIRSLVIAQDTGGAIKGPVRGDLFWGHGEREAAMAGVMKSKGRAFLLIPKALKP